MPEAVRLTNYTIADLFQIVTAFVLFIPLLFAPGYVAGWAANAIRFRERTIAEKLLIATPVSISLTPLLIYFYGRVASLHSCWIVFALLFLAFALLLGHDVWK